MKTVIFDIDGTLSDPTHRRHHVLTKPKNWAAWNAGMHLDKPNEPIVALSRILRHFYSIVLCTGREEAYRQVTLDWLEKHDIRFDEMHMRPTADYRADDIIKSEMLDRMLAAKCRIQFVVEDRDRLVKMWRSRGLTCLQCTEGDF